MLSFLKTKEVSLRGEFEAQKVSLFTKSCFALLVIAFVGSSFVDELGIVKHIWIAGLAAFSTFKLHREYILPAVLTKMSVTDSDFRANSYIVIFSYILGSTSGAGLLTAFINLIGMSAAVSLIHPFLPKCYSASLYALLSITSLTLAFFKALHLYLSVPLAVVSTAISVYKFKSAFNPEKSSANEDGVDVESVSILTGLPKVTVFSSKSVWKEIFKTTTALILTGLGASIVLYWIMLSINPFWMLSHRISKYEPLHRLPHDVNLSVREVSSLQDLEMYRNKLEKQFPVVIKPSICSTNSRYVKKCSDYKCLEKYLRERIANGPLNDQKNGDIVAWVIQDYVHSTEGVVFYYKLPYWSKGAIKNIGIRTESTKIPGKRNTSLNAQYWPETFRTDFSKKYLEFFDDLASKIPGYTGGRFDVMLPSSFDSDLIDPRGTTVLELNIFFLGCIQEKNPKSVWGELKRIRTSLMQIYIGIVNIVGGYNFLSFWGIARKVPELVSRAIVCGNHEHLMAIP